MKENTVIASKTGIQNLTVSQVTTWLEAVKDPEIPVLSLVDLGVISSVEVNSNSVHVVMTPTFVGCPAIDYMKQEVLDTLKNKGIENPVVTLSFKEPWTSDKISEKGRMALKDFGLAPPPQGKNLFTDIDILEHATCPRCNSKNTELRNPFGSTLCRSIHYCLECREAFEQFKPL